MKQPVELYHDFSQLSDCLKDIEKLAEQLGLDLDDLVTEPASNSLRINDKRKVILLNHFEEKR